MCSSYFGCHLQGEILCGFNQTKSQYKINVKHSFDILWRTIQFILNVLNT